jgi:hypothetical protein
MVALESVLSSDRLDSVRCRRMEPLVASTFRERCSGPPVGDANE